MNFGMTLTKLTSQYRSYKTQVRWGIVAIGVIVNGAILLSTLTEKNSSQDFASVVYLPPSAITTQHAGSVNPSIDQSVKASASSAQEHLALADALAYAGERDAAVEHYLQAMTYRLKSHSYASHPQAQTQSYTQPD